MPKIELKDKLLQVKISKEFYQRIVSYCQKHSASISAGATSLLRRQLDADEKKGIATEITVSDEVKNEIMKAKQSYDSVNDYVDRVMRDHFYYKSKRENQQEANPYSGDTKYSNRDSMNQDAEVPKNALLKSMGYKKEKQ